MFTTGVSAYQASPPVPGFPADGRQQETYPTQVIILIITIYKCQLVPLYSTFKLNAVLDECEIVKCVWPTPYLETLANVSTFKPFILCTQETMMSMLEQGGNTYPQEEFNDLNMFPTFSESWILEPWKTYALYNRPFIALNLSAIDYVATMLACTKKLHLLWLCHAIFLPVLHSLKSSWILFWFLLLPWIVFLRTCNTYHFLWSMYKVHRLMGYVNLDCRLLKFTLNLKLVNITAYNPHIVSWVNCKLF